MELKIRNACKRYEDKIVLNDFNLDLFGKGTICLFGPSGCGKTTFLNCVAGLDKLDSGEILQSGIHKISYLFQEDRLFTWFSAKKNVFAVLQGKKRDKIRNASKWLSLAGLDDNDQNKFPVELSGGMRRRVAIARSLAYGGDLYLLDEPFQGLDEKAKRQEIALLRKETAKSLTVFITHDKLEADLMADVIYYLNGPPMKVVKIKKVCS